MHNLHYYVVEASSGEDACSIVDNGILEWGHEDNWRVICGAVSEYGEVFSTGEGRYCPEQPVSIKSLQDEIRASITPSLHAEVAETLKKLSEGKNNLKSYEVYRAKVYIDAVYSSSDIDPEKYNILYDNFKGWALDQFGVTIGHEREKPVNSLDFIKKSEEQINKEEERLWVVFIDMHS